jgi:DNA repair protein RadC
MGQHDQHRQRIYARFLTEGLAGFEEHTAMEFLLFLAFRRTNTNELAHLLIQKFGSLANVLDAPVEELAAVPGIGNTCAVVLKFIPEMCAYYLNNKVDAHAPLSSVEASAAFFMPKFFAKNTEELYVAALDDRRALLRCICMSEGISNSTNVNIAKIVSEALRCGATGVLLAHNHPRGIAAPSISDLSATNDIAQALKMVNIDLIDHLIFAQNDFISLAASGHLERFRSM